MPAGQLLVGSAGVFDACIARAGEVAVMSSTVAMHALRADGSVDLLNGCIAQVPTVPVLTDESTACIIVVVGSVT